MPKAAIFYNKLMIENKVDKKMRGKFCPNFTDKISNWFRTGFHEFSNLFQASFP
jgi:hypothetical protein